MSGIRELSFDEIALVSAGSANGQDAGERSNYGRSDHSPSTNYGGQANGFQPNYAAGAANANMYNDLTSSCGLGLVGGGAGLVGAIATRSITAGISAITGIIAGCKSDSNAASKNGPPFH